MMRTRMLSLSLLLLLAGHETHARATPAATPTPPSLRLGDGARPLRYRVELRVVPEEDRFAGAIDIDVELRAASSVLWLNGQRLDVQRATVTAPNAMAARVLPGGNDFVGVQFDRALGPGPITVHLEYAGEITTKASDGLFRQKENDRWYVFTHFEPIDARRVFPCFDEPAYKVPWEIKLRVKTGDVALSNSPMLREEPSSDGLKLVTFAPTRPLPSYLIALAVGPFELVDAGKAGAHGTPIRVITPHGRAAEARYAKEVTAQVIERLEKYFGSPYPFDKLDVIDVPTIGGAMENAGLVTFAQSLILSKPSEETARFRQTYTSVAAHELAHMWFGDLVTTAWWNDIWLNEAFATWMSNYIVEEWKPEWHFDARAVADTDRAMIEDALGSARSIRQPIRGNDDMVNAFDAITYQKGAAVIAMFESWVGRERFQTGIRHHLAAHAYGVATADEFLASIDGAAATPVSAAFSSFLNQPGVPMVSLALHCDAGKPPVLSLAQERYLPSGSRATAAQSWQVPVCVRYATDGKEARACTLLTGATAELPLPEAKSCPSFVAANDRQHGYYRARYEGELWGHVVDAAAAHLTLAERVGLVGDAEALVQNGKLSYADALQLVVKLANDPNREVVQRAVELITPLASRGLFTDEQRPRFARFVRGLFGKRAAQLGWIPRAGDDDETRLLRALLVAFVSDQGEDPALRRQAGKLARAWLDDRKAIDPELVPAALITAALDGDRALFDRYRAEAAKPTTTRLDRTRLLGAMSGFRSPSLAPLALALSTSPDFDARESAPIIQRMLTLPATRTLAYDFVKANFDALTARLSPRVAARFSGVVGTFCDEAHAHDAEQFFGPRAPHFVGGPRILAQAVEAAELCSATHAQRASSVAAFLATVK